MSLCESTVARIHITVHSFAGDMIIGARGVVRGAVVYWLARPIGTPPDEVRFQDQACFIIRCKNLALNIRHCLYLCLSGETLRVGPFYMVSMPGEVKYPTQGVNRQILCRALHVTLEKDNSLNHSCVSPKMGCLEYT